MLPACERRDRSTNSRCSISRPGYVQRSIAKFPKQSSKAPWRLYQNYVLDIVTLGYGAIDDGVMEFFRRPCSGAQAAG